MQGVVVPAAESLEGRVGTHELCAAPASVAAGARDADPATAAGAAAAADGATEWLIDG